MAEGGIWGWHGWGWGGLIVAGSYSRVEVCCLKSELEGWLQMGAVTLVNWVTLGK